MAQCEEGTYGALHDDGRERERVKDRAREEPTRDGLNLDGRSSHEEEHEPVPGCHLNEASSTVHLDFD